MGGDLNSFLDITSLMMWTGGEFIGTPAETFLPVLLNVSCHKIQEYIWFMGGDLNSFEDIKLFMKWKGWGMPRHPTGDILVSVIQCFLS